MGEREKGYVSERRRKREEEEVRKTVWGDAVAAVNPQ